MGGLYGFFFLNPTLFFASVIIFRAYRTAIIAINGWSTISVQKLKTVLASNAHKTRRFL